MIKRRERQFAAMALCCGVALLASLGCEGSGGSVSGRRDGSEFTSDRSPDAAGFKASGHVSAGGSVNARGGSTSGGVGR